MGQAKTLLKLALHPTCWSGQLKDYKSQRHGFCGLVISKVLNLLSSPEASYSSISRFFLGSEGVETASHLSGAVKNGISIKRKELATCANHNSEEVAVEAHKASDQDSSCRGDDVQASASVRAHGLVAAVVFASVILEYTTVVRGSGDEEREGYSVEDGDSRKYC